MKQFIKYAFAFVITVFGGPAHSAVTFVHTDALGSPAAVTNTSRQIVGLSHYQAYGKDMRGSSDDVGYTGHKFDKDLALSYMQARYYDPVIGRFYSNDPVDALGHIRRGNPTHGFNRYTYVNNSPFKYVDPDGEFGLLGAAIGMGVEIGAQLLSNGGDISQIDVSDVIVAGAVGAVTGGLGGRLASSAVKGTMTVGDAVVTTASIGGTASGVGAIVAGELNGTPATAGQVGAAVVGGTLGAGAGAKLASSFANTLNKGFGALNNSVSSTTRSGMVGDTVESGASAIQRSGEIAAEAASNLGQKELQ
ncbi:ParB-like nuclease domain protein [Ferrimonas balearica DSM 9799]|uniref:ParB-like nuclease domain protein n=1 Tax=Ferrimonas balearica (strain DSM 9799 / CCM 4581 / KCTC 23876 / PAT) TaxID=550540 RepID=E1SLY9_FERBD|nr:RHS repeat-associated core domain-containing protein [Ferrimonas balearica]ADN75521.1 ParB-like nuclease domain protein [Ferrimonas balearica DSM 9799]